MKIGLLGALTIVFAAAKLAGAVDWSWWLVFLPSIVGVGLTVLFWAFVLVCAVVLHKR